MSKQEWKIGDCLDILKEYPDNHFDLILTDPPYGIDICSSGSVGGDGACKVTDYKIQTWDKERLDKCYFDEMRRVSKNQIIFGGNYYIDYLKPTPCFIIWDKRTHDKYNNNFADCEIAWTSFDSPIRIFRYLWSGMIQKT